MKTEATNLLKKLAWCSCANNIENSNNVRSAVDKYSCVDIFSLPGIEHIGWYSKLFCLFSYNYTVNIYRGSMHLGGTPLQKSCFETAPTVASSSESGISSILAETSGFLFSGFFPSFLRKGFLQNFAICPGFPHLKQRLLLYHFSLSCSDNWTASTSIAFGSRFLCLLFCCPC